MKKWNKAFGWVFPAAVVAGVLLLSWLLPRMVPDYRNQIRTVDYDANTMISIAGQEDEIELYPWSELQEDSCIHGAELEEQASELSIDLRYDVEMILLFCETQGYIYNFDSAMAAVWENCFYDPEQERMYLREWPVQVDGEERLLSMAWSWSGLEYFELADTKTHSMTDEEADAARRELQEILKSLQAARYGYSMDGTSVSEFDTAVTDDYTAVTSPDEPAFDSFFQIVGDLDEACGTDSLNVLDTTLYNNETCDMIPYQGEFLMVFSGNTPVQEVILIYDVSGRHLSGCSIRY